MSEPDREFEEFLKSRRPLFHREVDDGLEPPPEVDRLVLDRARDAIRAPEPLRLYRGPRWAAPTAIAATLVLGLVFVFHAGSPETIEPVPEVRVENIVNRYEEPAAPPAAARDVAAPAPAAEAAAGAPAPPATDGPVVVELSSPMGGSTPVATEVPAWRRDARSWLAEIERLRAAGDTARADAELAEFNRQHRALAVSPDR
jgi:hypothetical protein